MLLNTKTMKNLNRDLDEQKVKNKTSFNRNRNVNANTNAIGKTTKFDLDDFFKTRLKLTSDAGLA